MHVVRKYRLWLLYFALAVPAIFLPRFDYMGPNRVRYNLGLPPSMMDVLICEFDDGQILHLQPSPLLLLVAACWTYVASLAWRARQWAMVRPDWRGALVQAILTSFYCALVFCFLYGVVAVVWDWRLLTMQWPALE